MGFRFRVSGLGSVLIRGFHPLAPFVSKSGYDRQELGL